MSQATLTKAMLMTAGLGTRLQPFTQHRTKALLPVLGIPSAQYTLDSLFLAGVREVVANVHHLAEHTSKGLSQLDFRGAHLTIKNESSLLLGTAGGIRNALDRLGNEPFYRANADVICDLDWSALYQAHLNLRRSQGVVLTLAVFRSGPSNAKYAEILMDEEKGLITGIGKVVEGKPFWTGAAVIEPEALLHIPQGGASEFVPEILLPAIRSNRAGLFLGEGVWYDIGSPALWLGTHFELMQLFERGDQRNHRLQLWKKRFLEINYSLGQNCWAHQSNRSILGTNGNKVSSPCYVGEGIQASLVNSRVGPQAVVYGQIPEGAGGIENGIAFGGHWVKMME